MPSWGARFAGPKPRVGRFHEVSSLWVPKESGLGTHKTRPKPGLKSRDFEALKGPHFLKKQGAQTYKDIYTCVHICMDMYVYIYPHACMCVYVCMHLIMHVCMHGCMYVYSYICNEKPTEFRECSARERDFERKNDEIWRMLRMGARFSSKFSGRSARERDFERKHGEVLRMLRTRARFSSKFSGCPARKRDFEPNKRENFENAPHGSAIFFQIFRMLRTGARFSSKFSGCSAREDDFLQNLNQEDELERSSLI